MDNDGLDLDCSGPAQYCRKNGTSVAAPMAAGGVALMLEANPILTPDDVRSLLTSTASQAKNPDNESGYGLIDILKTIDVPLTFDFPAGRPQIIAPDWSTTFPVNLAPQGGSGMLHYSVNGGPFQSVPLAPTGMNEYLVQIPAGFCFDTIEYYLSAEDSDGHEHTSPTRPGDTYEVRVANARTVVMEDDFESDLGWLVGDPDPMIPDDAVTGIWERAVPVGTIGAPFEDHTPDPGEACFVTQNGLPEDHPWFWDIDLGKTTLISPTFDLSGVGEHYVSYRYSYYNDQLIGLLAEFTVDVSNQDGAPGTWVNVLDDIPTHSCAGCSRPDSWRGVDR